MLTFALERHSILHSCLPFNTSIRRQISWDSISLANLEILRNIFGPERAGDYFHIRFSNEMYEFLKVIDVLRRINIQRLRWLGHVTRMEDDTSARQMFDAEICTSRRRGQPCLRWKDQIEEAVSSIGVTNRRRRARSVTADWNPLTRLMTNWERKKWKRSLNIATRQFIVLP